MPRGGVSNIGGYGGGGFLSGATPRDYNPASGGVPGTTNPVGTVLGNVGGLSSLISSLTGASSEALRAQYPAEYFSTLGTVLGNVGKRAAGDISDLLPELQTRNAEQAVYGGVSGSQADQTALLRALGLTRYGVEQQALTDLGTVQREIPQVSPFDPTGAIQALIAAQERADIYRAAPNPEAAYQRALSNATGGGGGGYGGGGVTPARIAPGQGATGSVDDILARYGRNLGGYGPPIIAQGTRTGAPWELVNDKGIPEWAMNPENLKLNDPLDLLGAGGGEGGGGGGGYNTDFGGGMEYGGGQSYDQSLEDNYGLYSGGAGNYYDEEES